MNDSRSWEYSPKTEAKPGRGGGAWGLGLCLCLTCKWIVHACSEYTCSCLVDCNESICQFEKKKQTEGRMYVHGTGLGSVYAILFHLSPFVSETHFDIVTHEC